MIRVVLDSNVYISAFLFGGKPLMILNLVEDRAISLHFSTAIRNEVEEVLGVKFRWPREMIDLACAPYWKIGHETEPKRKFTACPDPDDNRILECGVEAKADFIISGDKHLLNMISFENIAILRPDDFLQSLQPRL